VFNIDQCAGIPKDKLPPLPEKINNPIEKCDKIIDGMPKRPEIRHKMNQAYYQKRDDYINMPKKEMFKSSEGYYGTLFHELIHSTGHKDRLDRKELMLGRGFKVEDYAVEELTAEMGASYLKSYAGINNDQHENSAAYIESWLGRLKKDKKFVVYASSQAQKATDYILNVRNEERELEVVEGKEQFEKNIKRENELEEFRRKSNNNVIRREL